MQVSPKPKIELRTKIGRIAAAVGFALVIGSFAAGSARADNDHHGDDHHGYHHRGNYNRGYHGGGYYAPDYNYYTPQPNYYAAPDPYYYGNGRGYDGPPQGSASSSACDLPNPLAGSVLSLRSGHYHPHLLRSPERGRT